MNKSKWYLLLSSRIACTILAIVFLVFCILAVFYNVYLISGGNISSISEWFSYVGTEEIKIFCLGLFLFVLFMIAAHNAAKNEKRTSKNNKAKQKKPAILYQPYTLAFEGTSVTFRVPTDFEKMDDVDGFDYDPNALERFADISFTHDYDMITCYLHAPHMLNYMNAEQYVTYYLADCTEVAEKDRILQQTMLNGKTIYYYIVPSKCKYGKFQDLCAAFDTDDGKIYAVEIDRTGWKPKLTLEEALCFLKIKQTKTSIERG